MCMYHVTNAHLRVLVHVTAQLSDRTSCCLSDSATAGMSTSGGIEFVVQAEDITW